MFAVGTICKLEFFIFVCEVQESSLMAVRRGYAAVQRDTSSIYILYYIYIYRERESPFSSRTYRCTCNLVRRDIIFFYLFKSSNDGYFNYQVVLPSVLFKK
jgi:hypothetical protein